MTKTNNLNISAPTVNIDIIGFDLLYKEYKKSLTDNPYRMPNLSSGLGALKAFKRNAVKFGPYQNLSFFEIMNRMASDLVLFKGIEPLIKPGDIVSIRLGNENIKNEGDFRINKTHGEVFNVAPSFLIPKLRYTLSKWKEKNLSYILFNAEVLENHKCEKYIQTKIKEYPEIKFIPVSNWDNI